jgi:hypothetical protein
MSVLRTLQIAVFGLSASIAFSEDDLSRALKEKSDLESQKAFIIELENTVSTFIREYSFYTQSYQTAFMTFQPKAAELHRQAQNAKDELAKLGSWLQGIAARVESQKSTSELQALRAEYRSQRDKNNACSLQSLESTSREFASTYKKLHDSYSKLKNLVNNYKLPDSHKEIVDQARQGFQTIERSFVEASSVALQLKNAGVRPKICDDFYQFDIVLSLATTISEVNDTSTALNKINLKDFLDKMDTQQEAANFLKDSRRLSSSGEV